MLLRMLRALPIIVFAKVLFFTFMIMPIPASACSCAPPPDAMTAKDMSSAVFTGKVVQVIEHTHQFRWLPLWDEPDQGGFDVIFEVQSTWKGMNKTEALVTTDSLAGGCGIPFQEGKEYLVYAAYWEHHELETNKCTRTALLTDAEEDLQALGAGRIPVSSTHSDWSRPLFLYGGIGGILCTGIFLLYYLSKKQRRR